ncbi:unnamed protein product [Phytophthora lilii]|uniref:Unnamed protein product n=1 Tax=Phytophthora lilii TaxID=2077276 RepID=A0A9W6UBZ2_9STRA|nr:unnamed protein product [Phytophthora lilii]
MLQASTEQLQVSFLFGTSLGGHSSGVLHGTDKTSSPPELILLRLESYFPAEIATLQSHTKTFLITYPTPADLYRLVPPDPVQGDVMELELLRRVGFFCALWTLQCCAAVLGAISRDAIFLRSYAASSVAALTLALALSTAYALTLATRLVEQLAARPARPGVVYAASPLVLGSGLLILTVLSLAAPRLAGVTSVLLYLWLEVSAQWLTQQFWDLCAKAFDVAQSKKFFGVITFGSTCGSLLASFVVLPVIQSRQLPTEFNLLVSAGMLFFIAGVLLVSAEHFAPASAGQNNAAGKRAKDKMKNGEPADALSSAAIISDIQARTYLKHICFFDMLATVMRVLVDNTTLSVVSLQPEEEVKSSLSMINGLQSFLMIPMQLLSGPFFTHFGVMYGIAMLPVTIFLFGASTYVSSVRSSVLL